MSDSLEITYIPTHELNPYPRNSRRHSEAKIDSMVERIKRMGWTTPIEVDEEYTILSGHCRTQAAKKLKLEMLPCVILTGKTDAEKAEHIIASNKIAEEVDWDYGNLKIELEYLQNLGVASYTGFDIGELDQLLNANVFRPSIEPRVDYSDINEKDIDKAESRVSNIDRKDDSYDVICPACMHEFQVQGR